MIKSIEFLNNNIYLAGITMLLINIGSKYVVIDISQAQQQFLKHVIVRRIILFSIFYIGTKDILLSLGLTALFIVLSNSVMNSDSKYCLLSKDMKNLDISEDEYKVALETIRKYELQKENIVDKHDELKKNYFKVKSVLNK